MLRFDADGWLGDNTDGVGLVRDIERNAGVALPAARVLLIGAGGAAAGVLGPLLEARPRRSSWSPTARVDKAQRAGRAPRGAGARSTASRCGRAARRLRRRRFDVVVNATREQPARRGGAGRRRACCSPARWRST